MDDMRMDSGTRQRLYTSLKQRVIGQDEAIKTIIPAINMWDARLNMPNRPAGVFLLLGPTGTGKTVTAQALAHVLHGNSDCMLRIDCAEFSSEHETAKLLGCFTPGTQVLMADGISKNIEDIETGDMVITKDGEPRPVIDLHTYFHNGDVVKLDIASSNIPLFCTPDHKILVIRAPHHTGKRIRNLVDTLYDPSKLEWVHAKEIRRHDVIVYPRRKAEASAAPSKIDLAQYATKRYTVTDTLIFDGSGRGKQVPRFIDVNEDFCRIAGYYVAEGGCRRDTLKQFNFTVGVPHKQAIIDDLLNLLPSVFGDDMGVRLEDRSSRHSIRINCGSVVVTAMMKDLFGDHTERKKVPGWFLDLPDNLLWNFVDAAIMGDGSRSVKRRVDYSTVSPLLSSQMQTIIRRLGFTNHMQLNKATTDGWKDRYRIYVSGQQIERFASLLPVSGSGIDVSKPVNTGIQRMSHVDERFLYFQVRGTSVGQYVGPVYDISVEEHTSYVANGVTVSNSPPGFLGHRETHPRITEHKLKSVKSDTCNLSIVLFDEIEKAADSVAQLLLGVFDSAKLHLGDGNVVNFEDAIIFMTSNLGAKSISGAITGSLGFKAGNCAPVERLDAIGKSAARKHFTPEFINRIDAMITYKPLDRDHLRQILANEIADINNHITSRLGLNRFKLSLTTAAEEFLLDQGTSKEYGGRELKRTINNHIMYPLAPRVAEGGIQPQSTIVVDVEGGALTMRPPKMSTSARIAAR